MHGNTLFQLGCFQRIKSNNNNWLTDKTSLCHIHIQSNMVTVIRHFIFAYNDILYTQQQQQPHTALKTSSREDTKTMLIYRFATRLRARICERAIPAYYTSTRELYIRARNTAALKTSLNSTVEVSVCLLCN